MQDNQKLTAKVRLRKLANELAGDGMVLETHAGRGVLSQAAWGDRGLVCFDKNRDKLAHHPSINATFYASDSLPFVQHGDLSRFAIIDCDPYGQIDNYIKAVMQNPTRREDVVMLFTDSKTIIMMRPYNHELYRHFGKSVQEAEVRVMYWLGDAGKVVDTYKCRTMTYGVIRFSKR